MGLLYHDGMAVLRQEESETGRVNQKRRTRAAIVTAARQLLDDGVTPTVAQAAEAALVSRTTAYRYFPTQESLLLECAVGADVEVLEALVASPLDGIEPAARAVQVLELLNRHVVANETRFRTLMRLYHDRWLAATAQGDEAPVVREGRRRRWLDTSLAGLRPSLGDEAYERLLAALCVLAGAEAVTVLQDTCGLDAEAAVEVTTWAARTLLEATVDGAPQ